MSREMRIFADSLTHYIYTMAQGNILQGQGAGKVGDLVLMVRNGVQVTRVYTKSGARSGDAVSAASRVQRVSFGSAANQWELYKYVCTRMYRKGKKTNLSDYNYFVKRNSKLLPYLTKTENSAGVHCLMPGVLSEGNLGRISLLMSYTSSTSTQSAAYMVKDGQIGSLPQTGWSNKMSVIKDILKTAYPNATKVVYLVSWAPQVLVGEEGDEYISEAVTHTPVIIDLYKDVTPGEGNMTIAAYFASKIGDNALGNALSNMTGAFVNSQAVFIAHAASEDINDVLMQTSVLLFATDDNASDCYTTVLAEDAVTPTRGAYVPYFTYRASNSLRVACESYGYQAGVMRDDVAAYGKDLAQQVQAYAAKLAQFDKEAAAAYLKEVGASEE